MKSFNFTRPLAFSAGLALVVSYLGGLAPVSAARADHVKQLVQTGKCQGCDLVDANLVGAALETADLRGANLTRAFLNHARLGGANLQGASFTGADLRGADLHGAVGANFAGAKTDKRTVCPSGANGPC